MEPDHGDPGDDDDESADSGRQEDGGIDPPTGCQGVHDASAGILGPR